MVVRTASQNFGGLGIPQTPLNMFLNWISLQGGKVFNYLENLWRGFVGILKPPKDKRKLCEPFSKQQLDIKAQACKEIQKLSAVAGVPNGNVGTIKGLSS